MSGAIRKFRKSLGKDKPVIMILGDEQQTFRLASNRIFDKIGEHVITVTDKKIYNRFLEGVRQAQATKQHNVKEFNNAKS